jgi:hypothetical protein
VRLLDRYTEIWAIDFEFNQSGQKGNPQNPVCCVAQELNSTRVVRLWGREMDDPPFDLSLPTVLTVGFYFSAESGCMIPLGWPRPANVIDLFAEFRTITNGLKLPMGNSLLGACAMFGVEGITADEKTDMRDLILRGEPFNTEEKQLIINYCASDVFATGKLFAAMLDRIELQWEHALARGRYMEVLGHVEHRGIPIDMATYDRLVGTWDSIQADIITAIDLEYGIYENGTFKRDQFEAYLVREGIPWPRLESGALALDDDTFKSQARAYPQLTPLRELRSTLGQMRLHSITVGQDGRNRCLLSAFRSKTGRNQPSNSQFIFGPSCWMRSLIKPGEGMAFAYCDYARQEFGIAAAYSGDPAMQAAYRAPDTYIAFGQMAGGIPEGATKHTHPAERERFKLVALAVQYGMTEHGLKLRGGMTMAEAKQLLNLHRITFPNYWTWSEQVESYGTLIRQLQTPLGWRIQYPDWNKVNLRSMRNWPIQSAGADMLRMAMVALEDERIEVIAPVHDAVLIQAPITEIHDVVDHTLDIMRRVSAQILGGFWLDVDADIVCHPDRYVEKRGTKMWNTILDLLP